MIGKDEKSQHHTIILISWHSEFPVHITYGHCTFSFISWVFNCTTYSTHLYKWYSCVSVYNVHHLGNPIIIWHLGCFHFPSISDTVAMNALIHAPFIPNQLFLKKYTYKSISEVGIKLYLLLPFPQSWKYSYIFSTRSAKEKSIFDNFRLITKKFSIFTFTETFSGSNSSPNFLLSGSLETALEMRILVVYWQ